MSRVDKTARRKAEAKRVAAHRAKVKAERAASNARRARWSARMLKRKRCVACGKEAIAKGSSRLGAKCLQRDRARKRKANGTRAWHKGGPGRPPLVAAA